MHMASIGLNLRFHGVGTRSGARTGVGGAWQILVTAPIPNDKVQSFLCSQGVQGKGKGSCVYEPVHIKLLCGQEVSPIYDLEQVTCSSSTCPNFSTLNVTAVYARRFYEEVCQLSKAAVILRFHGHAADHGH